MVKSLSPTSWGHQSAKEKGALLLASHEGKDIEVAINSMFPWLPTKAPMFSDGHAYRIRE